MSLLCCYDYGCSHLLLGFITILYYRKRFFFTKLIEKEKGFDMRERKKFIVVFFDVFIILIVFYWF